MIKIGLGWLIVLAVLTALLLSFVSRMGHR